MWDLLLSFLALSLVSGNDYRITQDINMRKNYLADQGAKLVSKPSSPDEDCSPFELHWP